MCYKPRVNELPARAEVAIIGGGFAGCATAWALARRGVQAVVLEREATLGRYASGRGAGLGRQLAEDDATTALTVRGAALLRGLPGAWRETGGILTFDDPRQAEAYVARAQRHGIAIEAITAEAARAVWPQLAALPIAAALRVPSDGLIEISALLPLFSRGATILYGVTVERVLPHPAGARLVTSRGTLDAGTVVDAAGAWAGMATGDPPLAALKRHLFVLEATVAAGAPYLWHLGREEVYVRGHGEGMLACPCDETLEPAGDAVPDPRGAEQLRSRLGGGPAPLEIVRQWACQRSFTPDRQMRLGRDPERPWLVWAAGLGGHGATASAAVGERVADAIVT